MCLKAIKAPPASRSQGASERNSPTVATSRDWQPQSVFIRWESNCSGTNIIRARNNLGDHCSCLSRTCAAKISLVELHKFLPAKNQLRNKSLVVWGFSITSINFGKLYQLTLLCLKVFQGSNSNFNHSSSSSQRPCPLTHLFQHHSRMPGLSRPLSFRRLLPKFAFPRRCGVAL